MPVDPIDAVSELNNARTREKHMEELACKWDLHFGSEYTESCASSYRLQDECREQFGLSRRATLQEGWSSERVPEPYRKTSDLKLTSDVIGYFKDDFEGRFFPCNEHTIKRVPFT